MSDPGIITKYLAQTRWASSTCIRRCVFVRQTDRFLVDERGRRTAKKSDGEEYFDTWEEAHAELVRVTEQRVTDARRALELANSYAGNVRGMKNPDTKEGRSNG